LQNHLEKKEKISNQNGQNVLISPFFILILFQF